MKKQYNDVKANSYDSMRTGYAYGDYYEIPSILESLGNLEGKRVLDIACGTGFSTRLIQTAKAKSILGIDVSAKMIEFAKSVESEKKQGIEYLVQDAENMGFIKEFDLITGFYFLHYISSKELMDKICKNIYENLKPGGRFLTFVLNPNINISKDYYAKYDLQVSKADNLKEGGEYSFSLLKIKQTFSVYFWTEKTLKKALKNAGFTKVKWIHPTVTDEGMAKMGKKYWKNILKAPWCIFLECYKK